jgi:DNA-directed RNA polymerase specialized sigma24 family protein
VTKIVINSALMKLRRRPRHELLSLSDQSQDYASEKFFEALCDRHPSPEKVTQSNELTQRAVGFSNLISPTLRRTFQLRHVYGLSIRDTAKLLGVPIGTVKAQTARARAKLKRLMQTSAGRRKRLCDSSRSDKPARSLHVSVSGTNCLSSQAAAASSASSAIMNT